MEQNVPNALTEVLVTDCQDVDGLVQRGLKFLQRCGSYHGAHDLSPDELAYIGRRADIKNLMSSPNLLKWWNVLR